MDPTIINDDRLLNAVLEYDPVADAELIHDGRWPAKQPGQAINSFQMTALQGQFAKTAALREILNARKDTHYAMKWDEFIEIVESSEFEFIEVLRVDRSVTCEYFNPPSTYNEQERIYWSKKYGMLFFCETHMGKSVNSTKVWFEMGPRPGTKLDENDEGWKLLSRFSHGGVEVSPGVYHHEADLDCRKAMIFRLTPILKSEKWQFIPEWTHTKSRFIWLLNYSDTKVKGYSYTEINRKKIEMSNNQEFKLWAKRCVLPKTGTIYDRYGREDIQPEHSYCLIRKVLHADNHKIEVVASSNSPKFLGKLKKYYDCNGYPCNNGAYPDSTIGFWILSRCELEAVRNNFVGIS